MEKDIQFPYHCESMPDFVFELATSSCEREIVKFVEKHFNAVHPLAEMLSRNCDDEIHPDFVQFITSTIKSDVSIIVRDKTNSNRIIGVRMNDVEYRNSSQDSTLVPDEQDYYSKRICALLNSLNEGIDLFTLYHVDRIFHLLMVAVMPEYRNQGLASKLVELSIPLSKQIGVDVLKADAVNEYAIRALMKHGFTTLKEIDFNSFEYNGSKPFANHPIHKRGRLMALSLK